MACKICSNRFPWLPSIIAILAALSSGAEEPQEPAPQAFAVEVHGEGRPVLLIPGLGSPGSVWDATVKKLVAEGYQAHVFTLAGFAGQSPIRLDEGEDFLTQVHRGIMDYARQFAGPPALVGHSLGGTLALWLAAAEPALFGPVVAVDGVAFLPALMNPQATEESVRSQAEQMRAMLGGMSPEAYDAQTAFTLSSMITDPAKAREVAKASQGTDPGSAASAVYALMSRDLRRELGTVQAPVLLLAAGAVATSPGALEELRNRYEDQIALVPNHRVEVVEDARHFIMLDQPEPFWTLLKEHLASASDRVKPDRVRKVPEGEIP